VTGLLVLAGLRVQEIVALLAQVASFSFLVTYGLVHVAVVVFRRADPEEYDPAFEMPSLLYPAVPALGVAMTGVVISQMELPVILVGTGIVLLGVVWYVVYARSRGVEEGLFDEAFGNLVRGVTTRLPGTGPGTLSGEPYRVVVGVANPETQRGLLRLAAATARAHEDDGVPELVAVNVIEAEPAPERNLASNRLDSQRALLETTRELAADMDVTLRTSAVVAEDAGDALVSVIREENADQALVGWRGRPEQGERVFGSTLDTVVTEAPCDVSLVKIEDDAIGTPVALAGSGPHAPVAARRAVDFATVSDSVAFLLNVQQRTGGEQTSRVKRGRTTVRSVAEQSGLDATEYESAVVVATDVESAIMEAVQEYDMVCVGLSEEGELSRAMFGSLAERISREISGNVAIVRSGEAIDRPVAQMEEPPQ
jgi:nucleotide-binding universal stress UspA family protein